MCMHNIIPTNGKEAEDWTTMGKILASIAMVLTGCIIGISCAMSVPSSFVVEASLGVAIVLFIILLARQENTTKALPAEILSHDAYHADSTDTSWTSSISSNDESVEEHPKRSSKRTIPDGDAQGKEVVPHRILPPHSKGSRPPTPVEIAIHARVEKEKLRLSKKNETTGVRATARSLHFEGKYMALTYLSPSEYLKN